MCRELHLCKTMYACNHVGTIILLIAAHQHVHIGKKRPPVSELREILSVKHLIAVLLTSTEL